jgi:tRNA A-37 threonylcarbamoyl transferase component Bud32
MEKAGISMADFLEMLSPRQMFQAINSFKLDKPSIYEYIKNQDKITLETLKTSINGKGGVWSVDVEDDEFTKETRLECMNRLIDTLQILHKNKYRHMDCHLNNVLFDSEWNIKLIDFGRTMKSDEINPIIDYQTVLVDLEDKINEHYLKTHILKDKYMERFRKVYFNEEL